MASVFAGDSTEEITLEIEPPTHLKDSKLEREGTYEIDGENLYISFPEGKGQSAGAISISSKAVENAEAAIDGNTLTTNGLSTKSGETITEKTADDQYQEYVDRVVALGPKKLEVGETGTTNLATFAIDSLSYVDEIYPSDTSGFYSYFAHQDGKSYLLARVTYTNIGAEHALPGYATEASFEIAGNKSQVRLKSTPDLALGAITTSKRKIRQLLLFIVSFPIP